MAYIFKKLADDWESLTDAQKEELFAGTGYMRPSLSELVELGEPFKVASFNQDSKSKSAYLKAVPLDKLFIPNNLFGDTFESIDHMKARVNLSGGDVSLIHFDTDFKDSASDREWKKVGNPVLNRNLKKFGDASLYLDGSSYVYLENDGQSFNFEDKDFSIEMWVYPTDIIRSQCILATPLLSQPTDNYSGIQIWWNDAIKRAISIYLSIDGLAWQINGVGLDNPLEPNTWYHVVVTRRNMTVQLFINGAMVGAADLDSTQDTRLYFNDIDPIIIGSIGLNSVYNFSGAIDEVRVTKGFSHYTNNVIPPTEAFSSVVGLPKVRFAITKDLSNYYTFDESAIVKTTTTEQIDTTIASMNGSNQYLVIPASVLSGKSVWTIEVVLSTTQMVTGKYYYNSPGLFGFDINGYGVKDIGVTNRGGYLAYYSGFVTAGSDVYRYTDKFIADGNKHNIALVCDGTYFRLYCDGELIAKFQSYSLAVPSHYFYVGVVTAYSAINLYEVRVWDVARPQNYLGEDIKATAAGLKAWYLMNNIEGSTVVDVSNAGNNGSVVNSPTISIIQEPITRVEETTGFVRIDPFNVVNVLSEGLDVQALENISDKQWDMFFNGTEGDAGLGIAFALSQEATSQVASIDDITMYVDMKGEWRSAHKGEDFEYGYPNNNLLRVQLLTDGDYKINYQNMVGGV